MPAPLQRHIEPFGLATCQPLYMTLLISLTTISPSQSKWFNHKLLPC